MSRGVFLVLEGIDGAGKTTIAKMLIRDLEEKGCKVLYTYEPTDSEVVKLIKTSYSDLRDPYIDALTFALDRLLHIKTKVLPALEQGYVVISDRYFYSSVAYQSASGAPFEWVLEVNKWALKPDLAVYLDVDPTTALARKRGASTRFPEFENQEFLVRVREAYLKMVEMGLLVMVDASRGIDAVYADVKRLVFEKLGPLLPSCRSN